MKMKHVANRRRSVSSRAFIALLALVLVIGCVAGGTVAWLVAKTDTVTNTFTYGKIDITLTETERTYNIVPGVALDKDPKVTVKGGSEDCWLFVKVGQPIAFATGVSYEIAEGWTMLENGVYYREVSKADTDSEYYVLKNNKVTVSSDLTKEDIAKVGSSPTLTFTAYAVQKENIPDAATAWKAANPTTTTNP